MDSTCRECSVRDISIFSSLDNEECMVIKSLSHKNFYKKRQVIFHEGNPCRWLYILRNGRVKLIKSSSTGRQIILKLVRPGGIIGEHAVFENTPYIFTAVAMEDSELCLIDKDELFGFLKTKPAVAFKLMSVLCSELKAVRRQLIEMAVKNARERMADLILSLAHEYGIRRDKGTLLDISLTRDELGEMVGVTQETAIRLLSEFKENGLIDIYRRSIIVLDSNELKALAGD